MRRMHIGHSPFSLICQKNPKELKSPKEWYPKEKVDGVVEMNSKYEISTKENREFLKASCEELLNFGHRFPSPNGGSYYLGTTEHHGRTEIGKPGSPVVWLMYTVWV